MRAWEEREIERQKAFAEGQEVGIAEGQNELLKSQVKKKLEKNYSKEEIADMQEEDVSTIEAIMSELQEKEIPSMKPTEYNLKGKAVINEYFLELVAQLV